MRIKFIDSDKSGLDYNVGDIFRGITRARASSASDFSELRFYINDDLRPAIYVHNKHTGRIEMSWSLCCQDVFLIVDAVTDRILYTSKKYGRFSRTDKFLDELREAIARGFVEPSKFELTSEVEFMDI